MAGVASWFCTCGQVEIEADFSKSGRAVCYCRDCQAFARLFNRADILDGAGGTDLAQVAPESAKIIKGKEHLKCYRFTKKGPLRWYAACCDTPASNSGAVRALPLVTILIHGVKDTAALGPIVAHVNRKDALSRVEGNRGSTRRFIFSFVGRSLKSFVTLGYRRAPYFDAQGNPISEPQILNETERAKAYSSLNDS